MHDKIVTSLNYRDQTLSLIYIIIENMDTKTQQSQKRPKILFLSSILIVYKRSKDANNKDKNLKIKIYHMALQAILQYIYSSFPSVNLKKKKH